MWEYGNARSVEDAKFKNFKFKVSIDGFRVGGFSKVTGLSSETKVLTFRHGDGPISPYLYNGLYSSGDVTFSKGLILREGALESFVRLHDGERNQFSQCKENRYIGDIEVGVSTIGPSNRGIATEYTKVFILKKSIISKWSIADLDSSVSDILIENMVIRPTRVLLRIDEKEISVKELRR